MSENKSGHSGSGTSGSSNSTLNRVLGGLLDRDEAQTPMAVRAVEEVRESPSPPVLHNLFHRLLDTPPVWNFDFDAIDDPPSPPPPTPALRELFNNMMGVGGQNESSIHPSSQSHRRLSTENVSDESKTLSLEDFQDNEGDGSIEGQDQPVLVQECEHAEVPAETGSSH